MVTSLLYSLFSLDNSLPAFIAQYGYWVYAVLFAIIFCETGLVILPFLPGDSILFIAGAATASSELNVHTLAGVLALAAILGDSTNFAIGRFVGPKVFARAGKKGIWRLVKRSHLDRTHEFFEKYGAIAIVIGRFVPIVRTFAPFVAGIGRMSYPRFLTFSILGSVMWVAICMTAGYTLANVQFIRQHFDLVVVAIVGISVMPMVVEYIRHRRGAKPPAAATATVEP